jgi:hypothetical protein
MEVWILDRNWEQRQGHMQPLQDCNTGGIKWLKEHLAGGLYAPRLQLRLGKRSELTWNKIKGIDQFS